MLYNKIKNKIKAFLEYFGILDPVKYCEVYKDEGCGHVDGLLCNVEDCPIREDYNERKQDK